jgi:AraC-like DNA-binding protein
MVSNVAVKGSVQLELSDGPATEISAHRSVIYRPEDRRARYTPRPTPDLRLAGFMLSAGRLQTMFGDEIPETVRATIESDGSASPLHAIAASGRLRKLAGSLFTSQLRGAMRLVFMEAVVLQLLVEQTAVFAPHRQHLEPRLSQRRRAAVAEARDRLLRDLRAPPTLAVLAAGAGMSEKALNASFRTLYGTTVFETLRDKRLDDARVLLDKQALPMKTVAFRVGYTHVSNFTRAFARRFGAPPRRYLRNRPEEASVRVVDGGGAEDRAGEAVMLGLQDHGAA